jgi:hypothetical protein
MCLRLSLIAALALGCSSAFAVPLTLEYSVSGTGPPYTYNFRLVLDNHDNSWAAGQGWLGLAFGLSLAPPVFATWQTDVASYPVGPWTSPGWAGASGPGGQYSGPGFLSGGNYWIPNAIGDDITWFGTADTFVDEPSMLWLTGSITGGAVQPWLEPAVRVGDWLAVTPVAGAVVEAPPTATGGADGFAIGSFEIISHDSPSALTNVSLMASGTGDDSTAFSEVGLFVDMNSNGAFDPGVDQRFGQVYSAYPLDDGVLAFTDTLNFAANDAKTLLVVAKLNGPTLAGFGETFNTAVSAIIATGGTHSGLPTAVVPGIHIHAPTLTVAAPAGVTQNVAANEKGPGGNGLTVATFMLTNNNIGTADLASIAISATGSLDDTASLTLVALYEDTNGNNNHDMADAAYGSPVAAFPADDGTLTFTQAGTFAQGQSRRYFVVIKLGGAYAPGGSQFHTRVEAVGVTQPTESAGAPGGYMNGVIILPNAPELEVSRTGPVGNGGVDLLNSPAAGATLTLNYALTNSGTDWLSLSLPVAAPVVLYNCTAVIIQQPAFADIVPTAALNLVIELTPLTPGAFACEVTINSNDPAGAYAWQISGTAVSGAPNMVIERSGVVLNGGTDPLGGMPTGEIRSVSYTIRNTGSAALNLAGLPAVTAGPNTSVAALGNNPGLNIGPGATTIFRVDYSVSGPGAFEISISIDSNDPANNPYTWTATGTAANSPGGDGGSDNGDGGCSTGHTAGGIAPVWLLAIFGAAAAARRRREPARIR